MTFWSIQLIRKVGYSLAIWITVLIAMVYGTNTSLGIFWSGFALVWIFVIFLYKKVRNRHKSKIYIGVTIIMLLAPIVIFWNLGLVAIIALQLFTLLQYIVSMEEKTARLNLPKYLNCEEYVEECHLFGEFFKLVGRLVSCLMLILVGVFASVEILFPLFIFVMTLSLVIESVMLYRWNKKHVWKKKDSSNDSVISVDLEDEDDTTIECICVGGLVTEVPQSNHSASCEKC